MSHITTQEIDEVLAALVGWKENGASATDLLLDIRLRITKGK
jgi:hypothetical protein